MACVCKGKCSEFENTFKRPGVFGYTHGRKRCKRCNYSIETTELRCKCCHGLFKTKRTSGKVRSNGNNL